MKVLAQAGKKIIASFANLFLEDIRILKTSKRKSNKILVCVCSFSGIK
jgi:hypothetical protein